MPRKKANTSPKYTIYKYTVIRFDDEETLERLFECIPDRWFVDETKSHCYWPPSTGTPFSLRAIRCEKPDDSWSIYEITVISEGHLTYNSGFKIVREKCSQKYNTSSAEERIEAEKYRRQHPVLSMRNIEGVFANSKTQMTEKNHKVSQSKKSVETGLSSCPISTENPSSSNPNDNSSMDISTHLEESERNENENVIGLCRAKENLRGVDDQTDILATPIVVSASNSASNATKNRISSSNRSMSRHSDGSSSDVSEGSSSDCSNSKARSSEQNQSSTEHQSRYKSPSISIRQNENRSSTPESIRSGSRHSISDTQRKRVVKKGVCKSNSEIKKSYTNDKSNKRSTENLHKSNRKRKNSEYSEFSRDLTRSSSLDSVSYRSSCRTKSRSTTPCSTLKAVNRNQCSSILNVNTHDRKKKNPDHRHSVTRHSKRPRSVESIANRSSRRLSKSRSRTPLSTIGNRQEMTGTSNRNRNNSNDSLRRHLSRSRSISSRSSSESRCTTKRKKTNIKRKINHRSVHGKNERQRHLDSGNPALKSINHYKHRRMSTHRSRSHHRRSGSQYSSSRSLHSVSSAVSTQRSNQQHSESSRAAPGKSTEDLINLVKSLSETVTRQNRENERRTSRMEVTINKIFVMVGDLSGHAGPIDNEIPNDKGFEVPKFPITRSKELALMKRKLKDKDFRDFLVQHEKEYCCPTNRSTDTIVISKYLTRFITMRVRTKLTLKENGEDGVTLYKDYHSVYQFLIDVMKKGYQTCQKTITNDAAHSALRIVWGRSKQYYRDQEDRKRR